MSLSNYSTLALCALLIFYAPNALAQAPTITNCGDVTTRGCQQVSNPLSQINSGCPDQIIEMLITGPTGIGCNRIDEFSFQVTDPCNMLTDVCLFNATRNVPNNPPAVFQPLLDTRVPLTGYLPCGSDTSSRVLGTPLFFDDCDGIFQGQEANTQTDDGCITTIDRLFTASDSCGALATFNQMIFVATDNDPPTLTAPPNTDFVGTDPNNLPPPSVLGMPTCVDPCSNTTTNWTDAITSTNPTVVTRTFFCWDECFNAAMTAGQQITLVAAPTPPTTAPPTQISGDPHFRGFLGQTYDFHGTPNAIFNLITARDMQINSLFLDSDLIKRANKLRTYMGAIGITAHQGKAKISIACDREEGERHIKVNGAEVTPGDHFKFGKVSFKMTHAKNGRCVFSTPVLQLSIRFSVSTYSSCHLNMRAKLKTKPPSPWHGVLGQTTNPDKANLEGDGDQGAGVVDGTWEEYRLLSDDLFGTDFKYNLYTGAKESFKNLQPVEDPEDAISD